MKKKRRDRKKKLINRTDNRVRAYGAKEIEIDQRSREYSIACDIRKGDWRGSVREDEAAAGRFAGTVSVLRH